MTDIDHDILREYARGRSTVAPGAPLTLIEIGRERDAIALNIGFEKTTGILPAQSADAAGA